MSRDHRKLHVFTLADQFVLDIYTVSESFPDRERYVRMLRPDKGDDLVRGYARLSATLRALTRSLDNLNA